MRKALSLTSAKGIVLDISDRNLRPANEPEGGQANFLPDG